MADFPELIDNMIDAHAAMNRSETWEFKRNREYYREARKALEAALAARQTTPTDLIARLRAYAAKYGPSDPEHQMCMEAVEALAARQEGEDRYREAVEDAVDTLEAMDLHVDNPLYERLRACLEQGVDK